MKLQLNKKAKFAYYLLAFFVLAGILLLALFYKRRISSKKFLSSSAPTITSSPTPTPIRYHLPDPGFSGIRQVQTPEGEIKEIVGKIIRYDKKNNRLKIGDKKIPFIYNVNLSTRSAVIVDKISVDKNGKIIYTKADKSKLIPGRVRIIGLCPKESVDLECKTISHIHILPKK